MRLARIGIELPLEHRATDVVLGDDPVLSWVSCAVPWSLKIMPSCCRNARTTRAPTTVPKSQIGRPALCRVPSKSSSRPARDSLAPSARPPGPSPCGVNGALPVAHRQIELLILEVRPDVEGDADARRREAPSDRDSGRRSSRSSSDRAPSEPRRSPPARPRAVGADEAAAAVRARFTALRAQPIEHQAAAVGQMQREPVPALPCRDRASSCSIRDRARRDPSTANVSPSTVSWPSAASRGTE